MRGPTTLARKTSTAASVGAARGSPALVAQDIANGLYEGRFTPGQRLVEADMTERYGVGRGTVREALKLLAAEGVVELNLHRGAHIRVLDRATAIQTLQVLEVLTGLAARLTAERIGEPGAAASVQAAADAVLAFDPQETSQAYANARVAFFDLIDKLAGNEALARMTPGLRLSVVGQRLSPLLTELYAARNNDIREICSALLSGDGTAAEDAARRHIQRTLQALKAAPDEVVGGLVRSRSRISRR